MTEMEMAMKTAVSFPGLTPPAGSVEICSVDRAGDVVHFYKDAEENYYYETERGHAFKLKMEAAVKRNNKKS